MLGQYTDQELWVSSPSDHALLIVADGEIQQIHALKPRGIAVQGNTRAVVEEFGVVIFDGPERVHWFSTGMPWLFGHEAVLTDAGLVVSSPLRSELATFDLDGTRTATWRVPGVDESEDWRTHINGIGTRDGQVRYVSLLGISDVAEGWRAEAAAGRGMVLDVTTGDPVLEDLLFPHTPRVVDGDLLVLESGRGRVLCASDGSVIAQHDGWLRGMAIDGEYAFIGVSQARASAMADAIAVDPEAEPGIIVVHLPTGQVADFLSLAVAEIFDVQLVQR